MSISLVEPCPVLDRGGHLPIRLRRSLENLVSTHQSSSNVVPRGNLALGSFWSRLNIASSTIFKDAQQLYFRSFDFQFQEKSTSFYSIFRIDLTILKQYFWSAIDPAKTIVADCLKLKNFDGTNFNVWCCKVITLWMQLLKIYYVISEKRRSRCRYLT